MLYIAYSLDCSKFNSALDVSVYVKSSEDAGDKEQVAVVAATREANPSGTAVAGVVSRLSRKSPEVEQGLFQQVRPRSINREV